MLAKTFPHDRLQLLLPTVLDLAGLPPPDVMQGQSLAPLMRGTGGWTRKPIVLEEVDDRRNNGELSGRLEVVDGRWGASMAIGTPYLNPGVIGGPPLEPTRWHVMVYDLWVDPICIHPINEQRPDLVKKYTRFLEDAWKDHQALATRFTPGARTALAPEQLERLRSLGYIR